jgi:hypothetical protein
MFVRVYAQSSTSAALVGSGGGVVEEPGLGVGVGDADVVGVGLAVTAFPKWPALMAKSKPMGWANLSELTRASDARSASAYASAKISLCAP